MTEATTVLPSQPPRICVVGDLMLDRYTWGSVSRISPEAPIPVLAASQDEVRPGGAAYVGALLAALGCEVHLAGVVGNDPEAACLRTILSEQKVSNDGLFEDKNGRPTTCKHRYMGQAADRHSQQILRVDREDTAPICKKLTTSLRHYLIAALDQSDAVVVSDYGKGVFDEALLDFVRQECARRELPLLIDPIPGKSLAAYAGATLLKPNRHEAERFLNRPLHGFSSYQDAAEELLLRANVESVALTLDHEGMVVADSSSATHIPTTRRAVYDITGAGDVVISVLAYGAAAGWDLVQTATVANVAAGLAVEKFGAELVTWDEIQAALNRSQIPSRSKVCTAEEAATFAEDAKRKGQTVVFTNGCFDLLHAGHLAALEETSRLGDVLIVAVNSDASVADLKGPGRPIQDENHRARMLAGLQCVSRVVVFEEPTPLSLLQAIRPDVLAKGGTTGEVVGRDVVEAYGGRVMQTSTVDGLSTTELIQRIDGRHQQPRIRPSNNAGAIHEIH